MTTSMVTFKSTTDINKDDCLVIKVNNDEGIFDAGTIQLPVLNDYRGEPVTRVFYEYETNGKKASLLVVSGLDNEGKPLGVYTVFDEVVRLSIETLFIMEKTHKKEIILKNPENVTLKDKTLITNINSIARQMGYESNIGTATKQKIFRSLQRLSRNAFIRNQHYIEIENSSLIDGDKDGIDVYPQGSNTAKPKSLLHANEYKEDKVLDSLKVISITDMPKDVKHLKTTRSNEILEIVISDYMYSNFTRKYILYYDKPDFKKLHNDLDKKIYLLIRQFSNNKTKLIDMSLERIYARVRFKGEVDASGNQNASVIRKKKHEIRTSIKNIQNAGLIKILDEELLYKDRLQASLNTDYEYEYYYTTYDKVKEGLEMLIGYSLIEVNDFLNRHIEKIRKIQACLECIKDKGDAIKFKKEFLEDFLFNDNTKITIDKKYYYDKNYA